MNQSVIILYIGKFAGIFMTRSIVISRPDDWHVHLRDGDFLQHTVPATAEHFHRALVMPNLKPPLTTLPTIHEYRNRILTNIPEGCLFVPYMTFYLNESVLPEALLQAGKDNFILGAKLYPAGATTNSEAGATSLKALYPLFDIMQEKELVLQIHGEVTHGDIFDREGLFIEEELKIIISHFPKLRIVLEHISTKAAVDFVSQSTEQISATITPHHLLYNRNTLLAGGIRPHYYCLPILKRERDQRALIQAATSGNPKFFAGTDSAPHALNTKEASCGCAGIYSAPYALALYAQAFAESNHLEQLNDFMSRFGAEFYHLPINNEKIELVESAQQIPDSLPFGHDLVVPIAAGEMITWSVHGKA